ncbi:cellulase, partial [Xanthomonas sp. Kuri4-1]
PHRAAGDGVLYLSYGDAPGPNRMNDGAVWRYAPATGEWHDITPAPQSSDTERDGFGWGAVAVDPADPKGLLASTFCRYGPHDEIFRSVDGGAHWTPLLAGAQFDHDSAEWTRDATPHWIAALAIDPFDADHAMFVTGYGVWASRNLRQAGTAPVRWSFDDAGLEETVPLALVSPATGAAALVSGVGDLDGFRHDDLDRPQRQLDGPRLTNTEALADAGQAPERLVRAGRLRRHEGQ